jgi:hypothetical protein
VIIESSEISVEPPWKNSLRRKQLILSGVLLGLSWADGVITSFIVKNGYACEGNPFIRGYVTDSNFEIIKIIGTLIALLILWDVSRKYPRAALAFNHVFVASYTIIVWWNVYLACKGIFH